MAPAYFPTGTEIQPGLVPNTHGLAALVQGGVLTAFHFYLFLFFISQLEVPSSLSSGIDCEVSILVLMSPRGVCARVREPEEGEVSEGRPRIYLAVNPGPGQLVVMGTGDGWVEMPARQAGCPARAVPGSSLPQCGEWHLDCAFLAAKATRILGTQTGETTSPLQLSELLRPGPIP